MAVKIYASGGAINLEGVYTDTLSINPVHFDWQLNNGIYTVRDKIENQSYTLGIYSNIQNIYGIAYDSDKHVIEELNKFTNYSLNRDRISPILITQMARNLNITTLAANAAINATSISVTSAASAVVGSYIVIFSTLTNRFYQGKAISIVSTTINLDTPLDSSFLIGDQVSIADTNMAVNGSVTPVEYLLRGDQANPIDITVNITRIIMTMLLTSAGDLSQFGNIAALVKGVYFRKIDGIEINLFNVKNNREIRNLGYDLTFDVAAGVSPDGLAARITFTLMGAAIEVRPGENLKAVVQDDLTLITKYEITCEGYVLT